MVCSDSLCGSTWRSASCAADPRAARCRLDGTRNRPAANDRVHIDRRSGSAEFDVLGRTWSRECHSRSPPHQLPSRSVARRNRRHAVRDGHVWRVAGIPSKPRSICSGSKRTTSSPRSSTSSRSASSTRRPPEARSSSPRTTERGDAPQPASRAGKRHGGVDAVGW